MNGKNYSKFKVIFTVIVFLAVGIGMIYLSRPSEVSLTDGGVKIHGMYGEEYSWESITEVELIDYLPNILRRTNGSAVGSKLRGHFNTTEFGSVKLFVDKSNPPFIYIKSEDKIVIFNLAAPEKTQEIYEKILLKTK